jgi:hypothetical protein
VVTFHEVINSDGQSHCSREKRLPTQSTTRQLIDPRVHTQFLYRAAIEAVGVKSHSVSNQLLGLPGPYHRHAIVIFNICLRGPTYRSLTDTGGGYNIGDAGFSHTTPRPSQSAVSPFHIRATSDLKLLIKSLSSKLEEDQALNLTSESLHSTSTVTYHLSIALPNDVPPR